MKVSQRRLFAGSIALAGALGISTPFTFQQAKAASAPIGQTIWLQATNHYYVRARTDQTNTPLEALVTQVQAWKEFDVVDTSNGLIALRAHADNKHVSARIDQTKSPLQAVATKIQLWAQFSRLPQNSGAIALQSAAITTMSVPTPIRPIVLTPTLAFLHRPWSYPGP